MNKALLGKLQFSLKGYKKLIICYGLISSQYNYPHSTVAFHDNYKPVSSSSENKYSEPRKFQPWYRKFSVTGETCKLTDVTGEYLSSHDDYILIDVRGKEEIQQNGAIPGSYNIPLDELIASFQLNGDDFLDQYKFEKVDRNLNQVIYYCQGGVRSRVALTLSHNLGYDNVKHLKGGYKEWLVNKS